MAFQAAEFLPGVYHIQDALGVCMTLLVGNERALLVDTGYGVEDVHAFVRTLTDLPLTVLLTHGHHDHALGAQWFPGVFLFPQDGPVYEWYTGAERRKKVLCSARQKGMPVDAETYLAAKMPAPLPLTEGVLALGGLDAQVLLCPGHTPGSCAVLVPQRGLLLSGDDWNPCTWVFFPEALPVGAYRRTLRGIAAQAFRWVLCPHRFELLPRAMLDSFLSGLTDQALDGAEPTDTGAAEGVRTVRAALPGDQCLVFDADKYEKEKRECL